MFAHTLSLQLQPQVRRSEHTGQLLGISGADPLNLTGMITSGDRVASLATHRLVYRDGVPLAAMEGKEFRQLTHYPVELSRDVERAAVRRAIPPTLRRYLREGRIGTPSVAEAMRAGEQFGLSVSGRPVVVQFVVAGVMQISSEGICGANAATTRCQSVTLGEVLVLMGKSWSGPWS